MWKNVVFYKKFENGVVGLRDSLCDCIFEKMCLINIDF